VGCSDCDRYHPAAPSQGYAQGTSRFSHRRNVTLWVRLWTYHQARSKSQSGLFGTQPAYIHLGEPTVYTPCRHDAGHPAADGLALQQVHLWLGCELGLLQDLLHRVPLPKWKPPFWLSNTVRIIAFVALVTGLVVAGLDWIRVIDPFKLFQFNFTLWIGLFASALLIASLFVYRLWCRFLCPFGLIGWLVEQVSLMQPRINREVCKKCELCVKACPTQAMGDFYNRKKIHADCFACGSCIAACPQEEALVWRMKSQ